MNSSKLNKIVLIGASTGGPGLIERIVSALPHYRNGSIVIAQHMNAKLLASFTKRLDRIGKNKAVLVDREMRMQETTVYVLEDTAVCVQEDDGVILRPRIELSELFHPTIDVLFESASNLRAIHIEAYLLSGIGADGAQGLSALKRSGFQTVAQDAASSVVYGMPKRAKEIGAATHIYGIEQIIDAITKGVSCSHG